VPLSLAPGMPLAHPAGALSAVPGRPLRHLRARATQPPLSELSQDRRPVGVRSRSGVAELPPGLIIDAHRAVGIAGPYLAPSSASIDGAGSELSVEARVEALDGSERKLLLDQLARAYPDVVEAGFELVAQWRTECAEKRRARLRRHEHDRRRRRAAELEGLQA